MYTISFHLLFLIIILYSAFYSSFVLFILPADSQLILPYPFATSILSPRVSPISIQRSFSSFFLMTLHSFFLIVLPIHFCHSLSLTSYNPHFIHHVSFLTSFTIFYSSFDPSTSIPHFIPSSKEWPKTQGRMFPISFTILYFSFYPSSFIPHFIWSINFYSSLHSIIERGQRHKGFCSSFHSYFPYSSFRPSSFIPHFIHHLLFLTPFIFFYSSLDPSTVVRWRNEMSNNSRQAKDTRAYVPHFVHNPIFLILSIIVHSSLHLTHQLLLLILFHHRKRPMTQGRMFLILFVLLYSSFYPSSFIPRFFHHL